ncbi:MAG: hypothetical protein H6589_05075 [Flavobacteriales bacterium]|nr:hypothetical protein [Flavobacteriales bacterium]
MFDYILWFIFPPLIIFIGIKYLKRKKREKVETIILYFIMVITFFIFSHHLISSPSLFERINEYNETMNLNSSEISKITFFKDARHGNYSKEYEIIDKERIHEINNVLKLKECTLSEGNLIGNKYWKIIIETKSSKKYTYTVIDTHKGLYITLIKNKKGIGDYKNNYLRIILDNIEQQDKGN